jgi:hypothetical protein
LLELKQRAAYYYCISGLIDEGKDAFRGVLARVKLRLPSSDRQVVLALVAARIQLAWRRLRFRERNESELSQPGRFVGRCVAVRNHTVSRAGPALANRSRAASGTQRQRVKRATQRNRWFRTLSVLIDEV